MGDPKEDVQIKPLRAYCVLGNGEYEISVDIVWIVIAQFM